MITDEQALVAVDAQLALRAALAVADARPAARPQCRHSYRGRAGQRRRAGTTPGFMAGVDELIPPEVVAELAKSATLRPLAFPAGSEPRYTPSAKLVDFVRCRESAKLSRGSAK